MKKKLDLDALSVESFATSAAGLDARGTVQAHEVDNCTCVASCLCATAAYYCATVRATAISCTYTNNASCVFGADAVNTQPAWDVDP